MVTIVLVDPRFPHNIGAAIRAASCYGAGKVLWSGNRAKSLIEAADRIPREERMKGYREVELLWSDKPFHGLRAADTVCVELLPGAQPLPAFVHPENAVYVFGPEDGSVPKAIRVLCGQFVYIPSYHCLNLSAAVYTVLYDRMVKEGANLTLKETRGEIRFMLED